MITTETQKSCWLVTAADFEACKGQVREPMVRGVQEVFRKGASLILQQDGSRIWVKETVTPTMEEGELWQIVGVFQNAEGQEFVQVRPTIYMGPRIPGREAGPVFKLGGAWFPQHERMDVRFALPMEEPIFLR